MKEEERILEHLLSLQIEDFKTQRSILWDSFGSDSWRVRKAAEEVFIEGVRSERIKIEEGFDFLYKGLKDEENIHRKNASYEVLRELYNIFSSFLLKTLGKERNAGTLKFLIDIVGDVCEKKAVALLKKFVHHSDPNVRFASIEALGKISSPEALDVLYTLLDSEDVYQVYATLEAIASIGKKGITLSVKPLKKFMQEKLLEAPIAEYLGATSSSSIPLLIDLLLKTESDLTVRKCVEGIVHIVERARQKKNVIKKLRTLVTSSVLDKIFFSYKDVPEEEEKYLNKFLGYLDKVNALNELVKRLQELDTEDEERASYLIYCETTKLQEIAERESPELLPFIIRMFGILERKDAEEWIIEKMKTGNVEVVEEGVKALSRLGGRRTFEFILEEREQLSAVIGEEKLLNVLKEVGGREVNYFMNVISRMKEPSSLYLKAFLHVVRNKKIKPPKKILKNFIVLIDHPDEAVREEVVPLLEWFTPNEAFIYAEKLAVDESPAVRRGLAEVIIKHVRKDKRFMNLLERLLRDKDAWVRMAAIEILSEINVKKFYNLLSEFLSDNEPIVRAKVVELVKLLNPPVEVIANAFKRLEKVEGILSEDEDLVEMLKKAGVLSRDR